MTSFGTFALDFKDIIHYISGNGEGGMRKG
jgi:hypothetical protein